MAMPPEPDRRAASAAPPISLCAAPGAPAESGLSRRRFLGAAAERLAALAAVACGTEPGSGMPHLSGQDPRGRRGAPEGRLAARPGAPAQRAEPGLHALGIVRARDTLLYVPAGYRADRPAPLAVMLHGAGGTAEHGLSLLRALADDAGLVLLAPASRQQTWDVIAGGFGPDVELVDAALAATFARCAVDPRRVALGGFSDGASYALSLGLTNGDLFTHLIAFSPGFMAPGDEVGRPRCYVAHGTRDAVLPIDRCSRRLVPVLERAGYAVRYHEFDGPHTVPPAIAREAVDWLTPAPR
jgi:phospholipase/carboxylesterase